MEDVVVEVVGLRAEEVDMVGVVTIGEAMTAVILLEAVIVEDIEVDQGDMRHTDDLTFAITM